MRLSLRFLLVLAALGGGCSLIVDDPLGTDGSDATQPSDSDTGTGSPTETDPAGTGETDPVTTSPTTDETDPVTTSPTTDETDPVTTSPTTDFTDPDDTDTVEVRSFTINDGAEFANKLGVQLVCDVVNATAMRMRNLGGTWSPWAAYQDARPWSLVGPEGERTVEAEFRYSQESPTRFVKDAIVLDMTAPDPPTVQRVGEYYTVDQTPTFEWSSNGGGNGTFRLSIDDELFLSEPLVTTETSMTTPILMDGWHQVFVQERDDAGNWSESGIGEVHVDLTGPAISAFTVFDANKDVDCQYAFSSNVTLRLAADDVAGLDAMRLRNESQGWLGWSSMQMVFDWNLLPGLGRTWVEVEVRDMVGNVSSQSADVYRDDAYEGCQGNDALSSAWILNEALVIDFEGSILPSGNGVSEDLPDYFRIYVPEEEGGTLEVSRPGGATGALSLRLFSEEGIPIEEGYVSGSSASLSITGANSSTAVPLCEDCYCNDGEVYYYIEVRAPDMSGYGQPYTMTFFGNTDACL